WERDRRMLDRLQEARLLGTGVRQGEFDPAPMLKEYRAAFGWYLGEEVGKLPEREVARRLRARPARVELAAALDDWAARTPKRGGGEPAAVAGAGSGRGRRPEGAAQGAGGRGGGRPEAVGQLPQAGLPARPHPGLAGGVPQQGASFRRGRGGLTPGPAAGPQR